jgi:hypothetical protein
VLIHEYPLDYCGWLQYAGYLSRHGVRALAFDLRCFGHSECPAGRGHATTDVTAPALFAVARGDRYVPVADMWTVERRLRSSTKRMIVLPAAAGHGWAMLAGSDTGGRRWRRPSRRSSAATRVRRSEEHSCRLLIRATERARSALSPATAARQHRFS